MDHVQAGTGTCFTLSLYSPVPYANEDTMIQPVTHFIKQQPLLYSHPPLPFSDQSPNLATTTSYVSQICPCPFISTVITLFQGLKNHP